MKLLALTVFLALTARAEAATCRLALALALDVSGSVDAREYRMQLDGLATALGDPDVEAALFAMPDAPVALAVYEWSSSRYQRVIRDWVMIESRASLAAVRQRLQTWTRTPAPESTGLGAAMSFGKSLLNRAPPCWAQTLDISGDGKNNDWPSPQQARAGGALAGTRINALVITAGDQPADALVDYFSARVIQGPDAFVEVARGYGDYAAAMRRKLLRELIASPLGHLAPKAKARILRTALPAQRQ